MSSWASPDRRILIHFTDGVRAVFEGHVQQGVNGTESGGILLGSVRGQHLEVTLATAPTRWDRRLQFFFERAPFRHRAIAKKAWKESGGLVRYIGEWHTHPEDHPSPSQLDRIEWQKLAAKRQDGRSLLAVIVGRRGMYVALASALGDAVRLVPAE